MVQTAELLTKQDFTQQEKNWFKRGEFGIYTIDTILTYHKIKPRANEHYVPSNLINLSKPTFLEKVTKTLEEIESHY